MPENFQELLHRLAQIVIVAKCKCALQRSKSMTHIGCLHIDTWIVEELITSVEMAKRNINQYSSPIDSILYTESLDSLK